MFKVAIIGGDNAESYDFFQSKCINILRQKAKMGERIIIYYMGDDNVTKFSNRFGIETVTITCDWKRDGKMALKNATETILNSSDALIVFDDGKSNVKYFNEAAKKKNMQIRRIVVNPLQKCQVLHTMVQ